MCGIALNAAKARNDTSKINELMKKKADEEETAKILSIMAKHYRNEWLNIKNKTRELKEDFGFAEFLKSENKDRINSIFQSLFNIEKHLENVYIYMGSNVKNSAFIIAIELCQCESELKECLQNLIEGCISPQKQNYYKDAYIKEWDY